MKTIASAQADFRANDRDGNGIQDFWRQDIAGLFALVPRGGSARDAIKLIELSLAAADDRARSDIAAFATKGPKAGFWYRAIAHAGEKAPDPDRFAACTFPESLSAGRYGTYVISEQNVIHRRLLGHAKGIDAYPTEQELKRDKWENLD